MHLISKKKTNMPLGRRKVPFSNKQKKTQLRQKRDRKRENDNIKVEPVSGKIKVENSKTISWSDLGSRCCL